VLLNRRPAETRDYRCGTGGLQPHDRRAIVSFDLVRSLPERDRRIDPTGAMHRDESSQFGGPSRRCLTYEE
jgi:hypothetical protein